MADWTLEEDQTLRWAVRRVGARKGGHIRNWEKVAGLVGKRMKLCRERWQDFVSPMINYAPWDPEEDQMLLRAFISHGPQSPTTVALGKPEEEVTKKEVQAQKMDNAAEVKEVQAQKMEVAEVQIKRSEIENPAKENIEPDGLTLLIRHYSDGESDEESAVSTASAGFSSKANSGMKMRILMVGLAAAGKTSILYKLKLGEVVTSTPAIGTLLLQFLAVSTCAISGEGLYEGLDWLLNNIANKADAASDIAVHVYDECKLKFLELKTKRTVSFNSFQCVCFISSCWSLLDYEFTLINPRISCTE
ncbi:hypothetical protein ACLB2K_060751 [Fragaria x ananassa]